MEDTFDIQSLISALKFNKVIGRASDPSTGNVLSQSKSAMLVHFLSSHINYSCYILFSHTSVQHWKISVLRNSYYQSCFFTKYFRSARICAEYVKDNLIR